MPFATRPLVAIAATALFATSACIGSVRSTREVAPSSKAPAAPVAAAAPAAKPDDAQEKANKRASLERQLAIEQQKLAKCRAEVENQEVANAGSMDKVHVELELAQARLKHFDAEDAKVRVERARLDLRSSEDNLREAEEELAQLEMMYKEQDLADKTREIVLSRGKRRVERARDRLALVKRDLDTLETHTLPQDRAKFALEVADKERESDRVRRTAETGLLDRRIAVLGSESEIQRIEGELRTMAAASAPAPAAATGAGAPK